jgi:transposase-like protein
MRGSRIATGIARGRGRRGVGKIELLIPRARHGSYFPSFLEPRRRSEQVIVAVVLEAYVNG